MGLSEQLGQVRNAGVVLSESLSVEDDGLVLTIRMRVGIDDLDPAALPIYCAYVVDTLAAVLKENRRLRDRLAQQANG